MTSALYRSLLPSESRQVGSLGHTISDVIVSSGVLAGWCPLQIHVLPEPSNVILFGNRVVTRVGWAFNPIRLGRIKTRGQRIARTCCVTTEGVRERFWTPPVEACQGWLPHCALRSRQNLIEPGLCELLKRKQHIHIFLEISDLLK